MSRVGKYPVAVPDGVDVSIASGVLTAKGKNGVLTVDLSSDVLVSQEDKSITVKPRTMIKRARQKWGMTRTLIDNAVQGAAQDFTKRLEVNGVGYRAQVQGSTLKLQLGFSHDVNFPIPSDVKIVIEGERNNVVCITGASKQRVGQVASDIRKYRPPEPYKGKGVKYAGERIVRKEGKKK